MAKALSHPLRHQILERLNERVASPNELSKELDAPLGTVSYHVRALLELDCIELVETAQRRGALEHYYRATPRAIVDDEAWAKLAPSTRRGFAVQWFKETLGSVAEAIDAGSLEKRDDCHLSRAPLHLDQEAWHELSQQMKELVDVATRLEAETAARQQKGADDPEVRATLVMALYEGAPAKRKQRKRE